MFLLLLAATEVRQSPAVYIVAIAVAMIAAAGAVISPMLVASRLEKQRVREKKEESKQRNLDREIDERRRRDEKLEDYERQELVANTLANRTAEAAAKAEAAAMTLTEANRVVAEEAARQQAEVAREAARAAAKLYEAQQATIRRTDEVARLAAEGQQMTDAKLDEIHTLVNSAYTAAMQGELNALKGHLATLQELISDREDAGRETSPETIAVVDALRIKIHELEEALGKRVEQTKIAEEKLQQETDDS